MRRSTEKKERMNKMVAFIVISVIVSIIVSFVCYCCAFMAGRVDEQDENLRIQELLKKQTKQN